MKVTQTNPPPQSGHADTLKPTQERMESKVSAQFSPSEKGEELLPTRSLTEESGKVMSQERMIEKHEEDLDAGDTEARRLAGASSPLGEKKSSKGKSGSDVDENHCNATHDITDLSSDSSSEHMSLNPPNSSEVTSSDGTTVSAGKTVMIEQEKLDEDDPRLEYWEPKPPKILMENSKDKPLELLSQIQQYATTEYVYPTIMRQFLANVS